MEWNMGFSQHIYCGVKYIHLWHIEKELIPQRVVLFDRQEWGDHPPGMHFSLHCILTNAPWWGQWQASDTAEGIWDNWVLPRRLQKQTQASISCLPTKIPSSADKRPYSAAVQGCPLCLGLWAAVTRKSAFSNAVPGQLLTNDNTVAASWYIICFSPSILTHSFQVCLVRWSQRIGESLREEGEF